MYHRQLRPKAAGAVGVLGALAAALLPLSPADAIAALQRRDCSLTVVETKAGSKQDVGAENRSIVVVFDDEAKAITVNQDGSSQVLNHVTMTQMTMNGYAADMSLGIDLSSWKIVFQTYQPDSSSMRVEYGVCSLSPKPPP
jgi:hypothetical protein